MQLALECPTSLLSDIQPLADFDWILSHLVLQNKDYANYYKRSTRRKVLDNSVNELLEPCTTEDIARATEIVGPDYVVPPDWLGDGEKTFYYLTHTFGDFFGNSVKALPVVQGSSVEECIKYAMKYKELGYTHLAVPYDILCSRNDPVEKMAKERYTVVTGLGGFSIHLLGLNTLEELEWYKGGSALVASIDTGSPVLHGLKYLRFEKDQMLPKSTPTMEQMVQDCHFNLSVVYHNIAMLRRYTNG